MPRALACFAAALLPIALHAQAADDWQACTAIADPTQRLACFDGWAHGQRAPAAAAVPQPASDAPVAAQSEPARVATAEVEGHDGCHDASLSELTRFWELEASASCGLFGIRSYRPVSLSVIASDSVNRRPTSENPLNNAVTPQPYRTTETRIQLSVRSKLAEGLLTGRGPLRDSLWFGYTQQSYWQLFTGDLSRPFRNTDHEPELMYVAPLAVAPVAGWKLRSAGIGIVHQSNGQTLPLSRSWNRVYLMAGAEHAGGLTLQGRVWQRIHENAATDDNPNISNFVGRAELTAGWSARQGERFRLTLRNNLRDLRHGSLRAEWLIPLDARAAQQFGSLRLHTQLFTGYGDSLLDYNRRRTVLSLGVSLVDW
jgi:phospholipase A1/A2